VGRSIYPKLEDINQTCKGRQNQAALVIMKSVLSSEFNSVFLREMSYFVKKNIKKLVTLQSRVARNKFCCGLGVRAARAGSISAL